MKILIVFILIMTMLFCGCNAVNGDLQNVSNVTDKPYAAQGLFITEQQTATPTERPKELRDCYVLDASNGASGAANPYAKERGTWGNVTFQAEDAPEQMTVSFNGQSYVGTYDYSQYNYGSYLKHFYTTDEPVKFGINADNNELVYINLMTHAYFSEQGTLPDLDDPAAETAALAKEYAGQFIDITEYEMSLYSEKEFEYVDDGGGRYTDYTYDFTRSVGGIATMDRVRVRINSKGTLEFILIGDKDSYTEAASRADDIARINVEGSIERALEGYAVSGGELTGDYGIEDMFLGLTPDGELVVCVAVAAKARFDTAPDGELSSIGIKYIIYV